jgi:hypothetical protein
LRISPGRVKEPADSAIFGSQGKLRSSWSLPNRQISLVGMTDVHEWKETEITDELDELQGCGEFKGFYRVEEFDEDQEGDKAKQCCVHGVFRRGKIVEQME